MNEKVEGLLLTKIPYKERHLLGRVLLRNGRKASVIFYGGRGGGKYQKGTNLEVGNMFRLELKVSKNESELHHCSEWSTLWEHKNIRNNHRAFYFLYLMIEIIQNVTTEVNFKDQFWREDDEFEGIFNVFSNGVFYTDKFADNLNTCESIVVFLTKLLAHLGILPDLGVCCLTGENLTEDEIVLISEQGGFALRKAIGHGDGNLGRVLRQSMISFSKTQFKNIGPSNSLGPSHAKELFDYFCYQFHFSPSDFKSLSMVI